MITEHTDPGGRNGN